LSGFFDHLEGWIIGLPVPDWFKVILFAMVPIFELRGAIPAGIWALKMNFALVFVLSVVGNLIPIIPILFLLKPASHWADNTKIGRKFFSWLFGRTRKRGDLVEKYEALGLMLFVAIPLPITGAWTGSVAAFLFRVRFRRALLAITAGVLIAGCIVTGLTLLGWKALIAGFVLLAIISRLIWSKL
jgi:uncharacterized membrane protein